MLSFSLRSALTLMTHKAPKTFPDGRRRDSAPESDRSDGPAVNRPRGPSRALVETRCSASAQGLTRRSHRYSAMAPLPIS